jgi:hypothetical protein
VYGAILILVGMASSKAENIVAVENTESTLKNLEKCEANIKPMAENERLMSLLKMLIEGNFFFFSFVYKFAKKKQHQNLRAKDKLIILLYQHDTQSFLTTYNNIFCSFFN